MTDARSYVTPRTISPARAVEIVRGVTYDRASVIELMLFRMVDHGFRREAAAYLEESNAGSEFPFSAVTQTIGQSDDEDERRAVLRKSIEAMRAAERDPARAAFRRRAFVQAFTHFWRALPAEEARAAIRDVVQGILAKPDAAANISFAAGTHEVRFSSAHDGQLFEVLGPLRQLDPVLADFVVQRSHELSDAARRYPYGHASMTEAMHAEQAPASPEQIAAACVDGIAIGPNFVRIPDAIRTEFADAFDVALDHYEADTDPARPNLAPQQCWPSAADFRTILYKAGQHEGAAAAKYLDRIPDPGLRLFAQIELAAALAGLPQLGSRTMSTGRGTLRDMVRPARRPVPTSLTADVPFLREHSTQRPDVPASHRPSIRPAAAPSHEGPAGGSGRDFIDVRNASLKGILSELHDVPPSRIAWVSTVDASERFDFALVLPYPEPRHTMRGLLRDGIVAHFGLRVSVEERERDVWVMTAPHGIRARALRAESAGDGLGAGFQSFAISTSSFRRDSDSPVAMPESMRLYQILGAEPHASEGNPAQTMAELRRQMARNTAAMLSGSCSGIEASLTIDDLCMIVEAGLDRPLANETGLTGVYVLDVETDATSTTEFLHALAERLGLVVFRSRRQVSTLVVS